MAEQKILPSDLDEKIQGLASDIYLQTYLGTELYKKIESLIEAGTLTELLNPNYYNLVNDYCKDILIYFSMVEYLPFAGVNITNNGIFSTQPENSTVLDKDRVDSLVEKSRDTAQHYTRRMIDYLCYNNDLFPEYSTNEGNELRPSKTTYTNNMNLF